MKLIKSRVVQVISIFVAVFAGFLVQLWSYAQETTNPYEGIQSLLPSPITDYTSLESLLLDLPQEYREGFSLVSHSSSLQHGSPEFPRVVMGSCGIETPLCQEWSTVIAFSGKPNTAHYDKIEVFQQNLKNQKSAMYFLEIKDGKVQPSPVNPRRCANCHGRDPNVIWSQYPVWPSLFRPIIHELPTPEHRLEIQNFWDHYLKNDRYKLLEDQSAVFLSQDKSINPNYLAIREPGQMSFPIVGIDSAFRKIFRSVLQRKIQAIPNLSRYHYALAAIASDCNPLNFIPEEDRNGHSKPYRYYQGLYQEAKKSRIHPEILSDRNYADAGVAQWLYLSEIYGLKLDEVFTENLSLPLEERRYIWGGNNYTLWSLLRRSLATPKLQELVVEVPGWGKRKDSVKTRVYDCKKLEPMALKQLKEGVGQ